MISALDIVLGLLASCLPSLAVIAFLQFGDEEVVETSRIDGMLKTSPVRHSKAK
jgi:hypothetical protein